MGEDAVEYKTFLSFGTWNVPEKAGGIEHGFRMMEEQVEKQILQ